MKALSFLTFLALTFSISWSQDFDYDVSSPYRVIDASSKNYFSQDNEILGVKVDGATVHVQKWDAGSLKEMSRKEYEDFPKKFEFESLEEFNGHYYMFYSLWDKPKTTEQLFVREIDFKTGTFKDDGKLVFKVLGKLTNAFAGGISVTSYAFVPIFGVKGKFNIQKSYDEKRILIQYRKKPLERNDDLNYDVIGLNIYDDEMNEISKQEVKMPYTEAKMNNIDYTIDSKGNTYVLALVYLNDKQRLKTKDGNVNYKIELLQIKSGSKDIRKTPVKLDGIFLNEVVMFNMLNDEIICAGYYTKGLDLDNADGIVTFKFDENGEVAHLNKHEIPVEVLNMYQTERQQKKNTKKDDKGKAEFANLTVRDLVVQEDGSLMLIGEQYYIVRHTTQTQNGTRTYYTYHYNDILVSKLNSDGSMAWMKKLGKRQTGKNGKGGMSFSYFSNNQKHYFLFLDNIKNLELGLDQRPKGHQDGAGGFFTSYVVSDSDGEVRKSSLFDTRDVKGIDVFQFNVSRIVQTSPTEFVVEVYKKKKEDILIKVKVKV